MVERGGNAPAARRGRRTNAQRVAETRALLFRLGIERYPGKGYSRTSIDELLAGSGLSKGAFYFHFPSKEHYFLALMRARAAGRGEWWKVAEDPKWTSLREVVAAVHASMNRPGSNVAVWVPIIADFALTLKRDWAKIDDADGVAAELEEINDVWMGELTKFVEGLQARGFARTDRSATELADSIQAFMDGVNLHLVIWRRPGGDVVDALVRMLQP